MEVKVEESEQIYKEKDELKQCMDMERMKREFQMMEGDNAKIYFSASFSGWEDVTTVQD